MNKERLLKFFIRYAVITLGCVIMSLGTSLFLDANNIAPGGVTGIAIIVNYVIENALSTANVPEIVHTLLDTGILMILFNIPLFIIGAIFFGKKFILSTMYSTIVSSLLVLLWNTTVAKHFTVTDDPFIAGVFGGALFGIGLGLIFRMGSTTGGTDIIVKILRKKFRYIKTGMISMTIDITIIAASAFVYYDAVEGYPGLTITFYTIISIVVMALMFDWILYGGNSAKLVYIITTQEKAEAMKEKILKELDLGATFVDGEGAYTGKDKRIILCALKNFMYPRLRDVVREIDPNAFTIVTSAKEIYGEGYKNPHDDDL